MSHTPLRAVAVSADVFGRKQNIRRLAAVFGIMTRGTSDLEMLAMIEPATDQPAIGYERFGNAQGIRGHFVTISAARELRRAYRVHAAGVCHWSDATIAEEDSFF